MSGVRTRAIGSWSRSFDRFGDSPGKVVARALSLLQRSSGDAGKLNFLSVSNDKKIWITNQRITFTTLSIKTTTSTTRSAASGPESARHGRMVTARDLASRWTSRWSFHAIRGLSFANAKNCRRYSKASQPKRRWKFKAIRPRSSWAGYKRRFGQGSSWMQLIHSGRLFLLGQLFFKGRGIFIVFICTYCMPFCHRCSDRMSPFGDKMSYQF